MIRVFTTISLTMLLLGSAWAQRIAPLLPADTVFAIGVENLASHSDKIETFLEEAQRLELGRAFETLMDEGEDVAAADELAQQVPDEVEAALEELEPLDVFGHDAWLSISISSFNPMPAMTVVARTANDATDGLSEALRLAAESEGAETASEGEHTIYLFPVEEEGSPFPVFAATQAGDVLVLSSNPDVLRGVLRRLAGADEAGFGSNDAYVSTLGALGEGNAYTFLDFSAVATALEPFGSEFGFEVLIGRALGGLSTVGAAGSVSRLVDDGYTSESIRVPGSADPDLAELMAGDESASREPLSFVSPSALGVSVTHLDLPGWWDYLRELALASDELGNPDLDQMVMEFTGMDVRATLFDWMGTQAATITGELGEPVQPGVPSENLLGDLVYMLETSDEAAASQGLSRLLGTVGGIAAGFADPTGQGAPAVEQREIAGTQATSYGLAPGVTLAYAIVDGWVVIATSDSALEEALIAHGEGAGLQGELARLIDEVPADATSYSVTDLQATLAQTGAQTASQMQMFAGLAGGQIDFEALQQAGTAIEDFFSFIAERAGGSVSYTVAENGGAVRTVGKAEFNWQ